MEHFAVTPFCNLLELSIHDLILPDTYGGDSSQIQQLMRDVRSEMEFRCKWEPQPSRQPAEKFVVIAPRLFIFKA